jgi:hypothetical protein
MSNGNSSLRAGVVAGGVVAGVLVAGLSPPPVEAFPAFARKYGLRCTACHEAWPVLNDFGRAFRDNGYQTLLGKDDPTTTLPAYIPISIRLTPHYEFDSTSKQDTDQGLKTLRAGSVATVGIDLLTGGTLGRHVSFLVVPTGFTASSGVFLESAWLRFDNIKDSSWLNLKLGRHEVDLPRSAHRPWNLSSNGYLIYSYHSPGSASLYNMGENQRGLEWVGHDRGSLNRAAISVFNVEESPGSRTAFDTPGVYFHGTHEWQFDSYGLSAARLGVFGAHTTWPTTFFTTTSPPTPGTTPTPTPIPGTGGDLKSSTKFGASADLWFNSTVTPLHAILVFAHGQDSKDLITNATRDGTFNGGFLELGWTPNLKTTIFYRFDLIRNGTQGVPDTPTDFNDQDAHTMGLRYTFNYNNRAEYALHVEYSTLRTKRAASDGSDVRSQTIFVGIDFAY